MGDITGQRLFNYTRYITGKKNSRAAKECQKEIGPKQGLTPIPTLGPTSRPTPRPTPKPTLGPKVGPTTGSTPGSPGTGQGNSFSHRD